MGDYWHRYFITFWWQKIPELMRGLGSGIKEFKDASKEDEDGSDDGSNTLK